MNTTDKQATGEPRGPAKPADRRTRGLERRRDALYGAAMSLFVERGFDGTTMEDIAERADVARATVFNHFPRKADFINEWADRRRARASAALCDDNLERAPLRRLLTRYFTALCEISQKDAASRRETVALMNAAVHSTDLLARSDLAREVSRFVADAREAGEIDARTDPGLAGMLLVSAYLAVLVAWISEDPAPFVLTEEILAVMDHLFDGIIARTPPRPNADPQARRT